MDELRMGLTEEEMIKEYGFFTHAVHESYRGELNGLANIHTHGLQRTFNHKDFQIVMPMNPQVANQFFHILVSKIKEGERFESGKYYHDIAEGYPMLFADFKEGNRPVLRMLIPDKEGRFPDDAGCDDVFNRQLEELPR